MAKVSHKITAKFVKQTHLLHSNLPSYRHVMA